MRYKFFQSKFAKASRFHWDFIDNVEQLDKWNKLSSVFNFYSKEPIKQNLDKELIPKIIHQIWIGPKKYPKKYKKWAKTWQRLNPSWEYKLWTEKEVRTLNLTSQKYLDKSTNIGFKSDVIRYEILKRFGGLYIDTDFECIRPIPKSFLKFNFVACTLFSNKPEIANGMIMTKIGSKLIDNILKDINFEKEIKDPMDTIIESGPLNLTKQFFLLSPQEIKKCLILPSNYFYPFPNFLLNKSKDAYTFITKETIGIHHWEMSWMKGNLLKRIIRKLFYLLKF